MSGCENTEYELVDNCIKQVLFEGTGYAFNYGGKMEDIATLTNQEVKDYHASYYHPQNCTIILCGQFNLEEFLPLIEEVDLSPLNPSVKIEKPWADFHPQPFATSKHELVPFPSEDNEIGSITYAWRFAPWFNPLFGS